MFKITSLIFVSSCCIGLGACGSTASSPDPSINNDIDSAGQVPGADVNQVPGTDANQVTSSGDAANSDAGVGNHSDSATQSDDAGPTISGGDGKGVTLAGSSFTGQSGHTVYVAVAESNGAVLARLSAMVAANGSFEVVVPTMLTAGHAYKVAYYIDANANGFCNAPPLDVSGVVLLTATESSARIDVRAGAAPAPACSYFGDFSFLFDSQAGLVEGHPNHNAYGVIADLADNTIVGELKYGLVDAKGEIALDWPTIFVKGHRYVFALWTDDNGDGVCSSDKKFIYQEAAHPGKDPLNNSATDATAIAVTADIHETFTYHHETNQNGANFCQEYFPNAHYP